MGCTDPAGLSPDCGSGIPGPSPPIGLVVPKHTQLAACGPCGEVGNKGQSRPALGTARLGVLHAQPWGSRLKRLVLPLGGKETGQRAEPASIQAARGALRGQAAPLEPGRRLGCLSSDLGGLAVSFLEHVFPCPVMPALLQLPAPSSVATSLLQPPALCPGTRLPLAH